jgi:hypothetical protein
VAVAWLLPEVAAVASVAVECPEGVLPAEAGEAGVFQVAAVVVDAAAVNPQHRMK